jgi:hypothetical protein
MPDTDGGVIAKEAGFRLQGCRTQMIVLLETEAGLSAEMPATDVDVIEAVLNS